MTSLCIFSSASAPLSRAAPSSPPGSEEQSFRGQGLLQEAPCAHALAPAWRSSPAQWTILPTSQQTTSTLLRTSHSPCRVKSKRRGNSLDAPPACRESGKRHPGSRSSSKNGCTMASTAERRWVGVYSSKSDMRSMASGLALRNTCHPN